MTLTILEKIIAVESSRDDRNPFDDAKLAGLYLLRDLINVEDNGIIEINKLSNIAIETLEEFKSTEVVRKAA